MGMYTGVRCKVKIHPSAHHIISEMVEHRTRWNQLQNASLEIQEWTKVDRCDFIPYGGLAYMPDEWETEEALEEWKHRYEDGIWTFQCSLKNYEDEIETFFEQVLPYLIEEIIHLEMHYEEWRYGFLYELVDGKIVRTADGKIDYEPWADDKEWWE